MKQTTKAENYDNFICIADRCSFSCCKGWDIEVDPKTFPIWEKDTELAGFLCIDHGKTVISLTGDKACPFLNERDLCLNILSGREERLTKICRTFPRLINRYEDREEYSLSCACPEVVDMLYRRGRAAFLCEGESYAGRAAPRVLLRDSLLVIIRDNTFPLHERLLLSFHMLVSAKISPKLSAKIAEVYQEEDYRKTLAEEMRKLCVSPLDTLQETNELMLDISQNYHREKHYTPYLKEPYERAKELETGEKFDLDRWRDFLKDFQTYEELFTNCIVTKCFSEGTKGSIDDRIMSFQRIITEYILVRYSVYLKSLQDKIDYPAVRDYIVVYTRIIGYNPSGMKEFWQDSFDTEVWELGYLLLLLGS